MLYTKATYHSANHYIENKNIESFAFSFLLSLKKQCNWKPIQVHYFEALGAHSFSHLHSKAYRISQWKREEQASEQAYAQQPTTRCKWALCYIAFVFHMLVTRASESVDDDDDDEHFELKSGRKIILIFWLLALVPSHLLFATHILCTKWNFPKI